MLLRILRNYGECDLAASGKEGVLAFQAAWEKSSPYDLLCVDLRMPELDGASVIQIIRTMEKKMSVNSVERVQIIVISADSDRASKDICEKLGSDGYIAKPITVETVANRLKALGLITDDE